jgi:16S rRNA (guanine1207-N2)-methyltransferase
VASQGSTPRPDGHYFDPAPATPSRPASVDLTLPDLHLSLRTDRGVFGTGGVDPGTRLLLLEAPRPVADEAGHLVDVGCGYGPIALALAHRSPHATVWAVDVNERARALCAANAEAAGLGNVRVVAPDEVPTGLAVTGIWSNPPIRIGKEALHQLLTGWLDRLVPEGRAWLVVHKHLGSDSLARWLTGQGYPSTRLGSRAGYRLLEVEAPHR